MSSIVLKNSLGGGCCFSTFFWILEGSWIIRLWQSSASQSLFKKTHHNHYECWSSLTVFFRTSNLPYISHLKCLKHKNQGLVTRYSTGWSTGSKGNFQEKEAGHPSILHNTDATMHLKFHSFLLKKTMLFLETFLPKTCKCTKRSLKAPSLSLASISEPASQIICVCPRYRSHIAFASLGVRQLRSFCLNKTRLLLGGVGKPAETGPPLLFSPAIVRKAVTTRCNWHGYFGIKNNFETSWIMNMYPYPRQLCKHFSPKYVQQIVWDYEVSK